MSSVLVPLLLLCAGQGNLLSNGSFDSGLSAWSASGFETGMSYGVESKAGHVTCGKIFVDPNNSYIISKDVTSIWPRLEQIEWSATPGAAYRVSADVYEDLSEGGVGISMHIAFRNGSTTVAEVEARNHIPGQWNSMHCEGIAPATANQMVVKIFFNGKGTGWVDNVVLEKIGDPDTNVPSGDVTISTTSQLTVPSLVGFGSQDNGYFYNYKNMEECNPAFDPVTNPNHIQADVDIHEDRIEYLEMDWVRMFVCTADYFPCSKAVVDFERDGVTDGWTAPGLGISDPTVANGELTVTYVNEGTFDPYLMGPAKMEIDADTIENLVIDVDLQSNTNDPVTFQFFFDNGNGMGGYSFNFSVTPNLGMQRITKDIDAEVLAAQGTDKWTGTVTRYRIDPGVAGQESNLYGNTVSFDLIAVTDTPSTPEDYEEQYDWNHTSMQSHYKTLDLYQQLGVNVNITNVEWNTSDWSSPMDVFYGDLETVVKRFGDLMKYLIVDRGYTCIKSWIVTNEPNHYITNGNIPDFDHWTQLHSMMRARLDTDGLTDIAIIGSDDAHGHVWFDECVDDSTHFALTDMYSTHIYLFDGQQQIAPYVFDSYMDKLESASPVKPLIIGEFGFFDGRSGNQPAGYSTNPLLTEYPYSVWTTEYLVNAMNRGVAGADLWTLYEGWIREDPDAKQDLFGMWGYKNMLNGQDDWKVYPAYHAIANITRNSKAGDRVYKCTSDYPMYGNGTLMSDPWDIDQTVIWVNQSDQAVDIVIDGRVVKEARIMYETNISGDGDTGTVVAYPVDNTFNAPAMSFGYAKLSRAPEVPDFDQAMLDENINPAVNDGNGGATLGPNGILDGDEYALLGAILADSSLAIHDDVEYAWAYNYDLLTAETDTNQNGYSNLSFAWQTLLAAALTLGDSNSVAAAQAVIDIVLPGVTLGSGYDTSQSSVLSVDGDADGDGTSNLCEYNYVPDYRKPRATYIAHALNPAHAYSSCNDFSFDACMTRLDISSSDANGGWNGWFIPNYMVDADEFALIDAIIADPSLSTHDDVEAAWEFNMGQICADVGYYIQPEWLVVLAGYMTLGDTDSITAADHLLAFAAQSIDELDYDLTQSGVLAKSGDADDDTITNYDEYTANVGFAPYDRSAYTAAAVDDTIVRDGALMPDFVALFLTAWSNPTINFDADTMYDFFEMYLVQEIMTRDDHPLHHGMTTAWVTNVAQAYTDMAPWLGEPSLSQWTTYDAGMAMTGDLTTVQAALDFWSGGQAPALTPSTYDLSGGSYVAPTGNPDGDADNNQAEYDDAINAPWPNYQLYADNALDPAQP